MSYHLRTEAAYVEHVTMVLIIPSRDQRSLNIRMDLKGSKDLIICSHRFQFYPIITNGHDGCIELMGKHEPTLVEKVPIDH